MPISILVIFGIILIILLSVLLIICYIKYRGIRNLYELDKGDWLYSKSQFSMIESHYRAFKEGRNPYTVLRDIGEIIYAGFLPERVNSDAKVK